MRKLTTLALTAALMTSAAPMALAESGVKTDLGANAGVSVGIGSEGGDAALDAGAGLDTDINTGSTTTLSADSSMDANGSMDFDAAVKAIDSTSDVDLVLWTEVADSASPDADIFARVAGDAQTQTDLDRFQSQIEANSVLVAALEAEGYQPDDVVTFRTEANGGIKLYVDDRA